MPISLLLARRTLGADGKDYRANSVHAPFPKNQHPSAPVRGRGSATARPFASTSLTGSQIEGDAP